MKAYFVELLTTVVVMAENEAAAEAFAARSSLRIAMDQEMWSEGATEVRSLEHLRKLDQAWTGDCCPYNDDESRALKDILPAEEPFRDTKTVDMFATQ